MANRRRDHGNCKACYTYGELSKWGYCIKCTQYFKYQKGETKPVPKPHSGRVYVDRGKTVCPECGKVTKKIYYHLKNDHSLNLSKENLFKKYGWFDNMHLRKSEFVKTKQSWLSKICLIKKLLDKANKDYPNKLDFTLAELTSILQREDSTITMQLAKTFTKTQLLNIIIDTLIKRN